MQDTIIKAPDRYDWSGFTTIHKRDWCNAHRHSDGNQFNEKTLSALIHRPTAVGTGEGKKTREIIRAALAEGLIKEIERRHKERRKAA